MGVICTHGSLIDSAGETGHSGTGEIDTGEIDTGVARRWVQAAYGVITGTRALEKARAPGKWWFALGPFNNAAPTGVLTLVIAESIRQVKCRAGIHISGIDEAE